MAGKHQRLARHELTVACEYCDGRGVRVDAEEPTIGVVCAGCGGKGHRQLTYLPFKGRIKVDGVKKVRRSGAWAGGKPFKAVFVSYADFLKGKLP